VQDLETVEPFFEDRQTPEEQFAEEEDEQATP
jgi:hypothetical protein